MSKRSSTSQNSKNKTARHINNLKDLEAVAKLCRKIGIKSLIIDGIQIEMGDMPEPKNATAPSAAPIETEPEMTEDELLEWSVRG